MNRKQLITLLVLVVLVGGAGLLLIKNRDKSWESANPSLGKKVLGEFPVNDVAAISVKQGTNELNLAKKDIWRVRERNDYPASYSEISDFLIKAKDLKTVQTEKVGPSQLPRLGLVTGQGTNAATTVEFKDQGQKTIRSMLLGKKHTRKTGRPSPFGDMDDAGYADGRYVKVGDSDTVILISDALANIDPKPEQWLNKDFFKIEKPRSIAVTFQNATNSWKLTRETETGEWKLADAKPTEQIDTSKVSGVSNPFSSPQFNDVSTNSESTDKGTVATIETFDNFTYTIKVGQKTNDNYPIALNVSAQIAKERPPGKDEKPEDKTKLDKEFADKQKKLQEKLDQEKPYEKWVYLVSSWTVDPLLKERSQLLMEKKEEKKDEKPAAGAPQPGPVAATPTAAPAPPVPLGNELDKKDDASKADPPPPTEPKK
jgi:Domain of unknown function (DUF4340)